MVGNNQHEHTILVSHMTSFFKNLFQRENPNEVMKPLLDAVIAEGRRIQWYEEGQVPDSIDGRFDMIVAILALVLMRLEQEADKAQEYVWLSELFVNDMDGQLRQIGIGDMVVGKHIGRMMGAVGGRLSAYKAALEDTGDGANGLSDALTRNLYRGTPPPVEAITFIAQKLTDFHTKLNSTKVDILISGQLPESI